MKADLISRIPLFSSLTREELGGIACALRQVDLGSGEVLFHEGDYGDSLYIVIEGRLDVIKALGKPEERLLSTRGTLEYFGEMSLIYPDRLRTASVRARSPVQLLEMTRQQFEALLHRQPAVAFEIAKSLCACLHDSDNAAIRDLQAKNRQLARACEDLRSAQAQVIEKEKLEHELLLAREIQESILPRTLPTFWGYDFGARMVPAKAVGGDFYDFIPLDDYSLGIAIGDVSDKGVPSALFMAMTRSFLRAEARRSLTPFEVLRGVNSHLMELNDAGMFVTVLYGVLHFPSRRFRYVRAGHTLPILCRSDGCATEPPRTLSHPLAILPEPAFDEQSVELPPDSLMLIYTDGLTEATNDRQELYGGKRLQDVLRAHRARPASELCDRIVRAVLDYQAEVPLHDDITLVVVRSPV